MTPEQEREVGREFLDMLDRLQARGLFGPGHGVLNQEVLKVVASRAIVYAFADGVVAGAGRN